MYLMYNSYPIWKVTLRMFMNYIINFIKCTHFWIHITLKVNCLCFNDFECWFHAEQNFLNMVIFLCLSNRNFLVDITLNSLLISIDTFKNDQCNTVKARLLHHRSDIPQYSLYPIHLQNTCIIWCTVRKDSKLSHLRI
jgi:hypothetical protein